jgi:small-conductance mechanosensitive channel
MESVSIDYFGLEKWAISTFGEGAAIFSKVFFVVAVITLAIFISRVLIKQINKRLGGGNRTVTIFITAARVSVWLAAALVLCEPVLGLEPSAFLAALGVGSLVISLGLQSTIANIIAGIQLTTHNSIRVGDHIIIGEYRGWVTDISWRNISIIDIDGNDVTIPNALSDTTVFKILNDKNSHRHDIRVEVRPTSDLDMVAQDICSRADKALADGGWACSDFPTEVRFAGSTAYGTQAIIRIHINREEDTPDAVDAVVRSIKQQEYLSDATISKAVSPTLL